MQKDTYKYELHCHTSEVSLCSKISARDIAEEYKKAGYDGVVITDHYSPMTFHLYQKIFHQKAVDKYLKGYNAVKQFEDENFTVLFGMEIRYHFTINDYLVYGISEEFLRKNTHLMIKYPKQFFKIAKENGLLVVQAHPYRKFITRTAPDYLDGIEVYNGKAKSDEENVNALKWAEKCNFKLQTSGSDCHCINGAAKGGIITTEKICNNHDLINILKNNKYKLIKNGESQNGL